MGLTSKSVETIQMFEFLKQEIFHKAINLPCIKILKYQNKSVTFDIYKNLSSVNCLLCVY